MRLKLNITKTTLIMLNKTAKTPKLEQSQNQSKCFNCDKPHKWSTDLFINEKRGYLEQAKIILCDDCKNINQRKQAQLAQLVEYQIQERAR